MDLKNCNFVGLQSIRSSSSMYLAYFKDVKSPKKRASRIGLLPSTELFFLSFLNSKKYTKLFELGLFIA